MFKINKPEVTKLSTHVDDPAEMDAEENGNLNAPFELDIVISNVVCTFNVRCHLRLREIALKGLNVEYRRENGMLTMRIRRPYTTASIWPSGRVTCSGAISESQAKVAARRYARSLSKLGFPVRFQQFRIVNVLGTCSMPWPIHIVNFSERHRQNASYEPELHPGVTYKMRDLKATIKIFSTGSITVTAPSVDAVEKSIQLIYPLVYEFRKRAQVEIVDDVSKTNTANPNSTLLQFPNPLSRSISLPFKVPPTMMMNKGIRREEPPAQATTTTPENICGNARRRATEGWASKLKVKRPRFNEAGSLAILNASNLARNFCKKNKLRKKIANEEDMELGIHESDHEQPEEHDTDSDNDEDEDD